MTRTITAAIALTALAMSGATLRRLEEESQTDLDDRAESVGADQRVAENAPPAKLTRQQIRRNARARAKR